MATVTTSWPADKDYATEVGNHAHLTVAALCQQGVPREPRYATTMAVIETARQICAAYGANTPRQRAFRQEVATVAAVYVNRFMPDDGWGFAGAEVWLDGARPDLAFRRVADGAMLLDEIKTGVSRNSPHVAVREQVLRQLKAGTARWGPRMLGVRLLWLSAPNRSQLFAPGRQRAVALPGTDLWEVA